MNREIVFGITKAKLDLTLWDKSSPAEFDGRQRKRTLVKIIGE